MSRVQLVLNVTDLSQSVNFYTGILGVPPQTVAGNSAFFSLDSPAISIELRSCGEQCDLGRLGLIFEEDEAVVDIAARLNASDDVSLFTESEEGHECWTKSPDGLDLMFRSGDEVV